MGDKYRAILLEAVEELDFNQNKTIINRSTDRIREKNLLNNGGRVLIVLLESLVDTRKLVAQLFNAQVLVERLDDQPVLIQKSKKLKLSDKSQLSCNLCPFETCLSSGLKRHVSIKHLKRIKKRSVRKRAKKSQRKFIN